MKVLFIAVAAAIGIGRSEGRTTAKKPQHKPAPNTPARSLLQHVAHIENKHIKGNNSKSKESWARALLKDQMGLLDGYGCWCYFESDHGAGKGKPVDSIDEFCKTLHDGYTCILMDAADAGITCIPWEVPYTSAFGGGMPTGMDIDTLRSECDNKNGGSNTCESWSCKVEGWFVQSYFRYGVEGGVIDTTKQHVNGFDPSTECVTTPGVKSVDKECCNIFPERFPFKTYGGARSCCNDHTYDPTVKQCCADGKSKVTC